MVVRLALLRSVVPRQIHVCPPRPVLCTSSAQYWGALGYSAAAECCVRCAQRAEECATDSVVPVMLLDLVLVVRQVSHDDLGETEAETKASPRPAEPTELGALNAAGRTNAAEEPHGSGSTVPSPSRSVLLPPAHKRANPPLHRMLELSVHRGHCGLSRAV